jgi:cytochrome P450
MFGFLRGVHARGFLHHAGDLWREHGDSFQTRVGPRRLFFAMHPDAVEHVNVTHRKKFDKVGSYDAVRRYLTGEGLVGSTGDLWRRQRKLLAPFFTPKGIVDYAELMIRDGVRLQERWQHLAQTGAEVEISEEMSAVTASIILRAMFSSQPVGAVEEMKHAIETMIGFVEAKANGFLLPDWLPTSANRKYRAARDHVHRFIEQLVAERRGMDEAAWPGDLLSRLMKARDEETGATMSEALLRDEAITTFFAGHETTARTMTFAWYELAQNPHVTARLHEELYRVLDGKAPTVDALRKLPYTLHVVKEVLRLHPAAPFYARDAVEDDELCGFEVAAGTCVLLSPYYTHRHPDFWARPEAFDPDRWTNAPNEHGHAFHPFAGGPRICIGNNFSLLETHLLLAILAHRFMPKLRDGYEARWQMRGVLGLAGGLPMTIATR